MLRECLHDIQGRTRLQKMINAGIYLASAGLFQFEQGFSRTSENIISAGFFITALAIVVTPVASEQLPEASNSQQQDQGTRSMSIEPELD